MNQEKEKKDTFTIYQLDPRNMDMYAMAHIRFRPYRDMLAAGETLVFSRYREVYTDALDQSATLDNIFSVFNQDDKPEGYKGCSVSVSDVIVLNRDGEAKAYYVDDIGFREVPEFFESADNAREAKADGNRTETSELELAARFFEDKLERCFPQEKLAYQMAISLLRAADENASFPEFTIIDRKTGQYPDTGNIALNEEWAKHLVYCDIDGFIVGEDGNLMLLDDCGSVAYPPADRFLLVAKQPRQAAEFALSAEIDTMARGEEVADGGTPYRATERLSMTWLRDKGNIGRWVWIEMLTPDDPNNFPFKASGYYQIKGSTCPGWSLHCGYPGVSYQFEFNTYGKDWVAYVGEIIRI